MIEIYDDEDLPEELDYWNIMTDEERAGPVDALARAIDQDVFDSIFGKSDEQA